MSKVRTTYKGEVRIHCILWHCAESQMETAKEKLEGRFYFHLAAMLMSFLSYEAYLNYLGECIAPDIWENERKFFSKNPYRGINGKLKKLLEVLGYKPDKSAMPYQTISELKKFRDFVSHGKPEKYNDVAEHDEGQEPFMFYKRKTENYVSEEKAKRAVEDVKEFIDILHGLARKKFPGSVRGKRPLDQPSQIETSSSQRITSAGELQ